VISIVNVSDEYPLSFNRQHSDIGDWLEDKRTEYWNCRCC